MNLEFLFGTRETGIEIREKDIHLNLRSFPLTGNNRLTIARNIKVTEKSNDSLFFEGDEIKGGIFIERSLKDISAKTQAIYNEILRQIPGYNLCRTWNYIPDIHGNTDEGLVYEQFNKGRYKAYENYRKDYPHFMPPASTGIDILGDCLVVVFLATLNRVEHISNPLQTDSFNYPEKYGKNPPFFSRAAKILLYGKEVVFVSGTASIRGSTTVYQGDEQKQADTTVENIMVLLETAGLSSRDMDNYTFEKVIYIRNIDRAGPVMKYLSDRYPVFADGIMLHADVCRKELDIEICLTARQI